ncbi:hypothetical protein THRCLA_03245 [Thraustotheca clavata]|uniref:HTH myb-type domain-containing protein n=1 Tax=Thraustotheca clavata TaxID=74557 RepID=A0A1W0A2Q5_9STRA|nr:hypothetical protein THRCLA_03245 [Thraustotheca clavata]
MSYRSVSSTSSESDSTDDQFNTSTKKQGIAHGLWSVEEHERFLVGVQLYPEGPWKAVADIIQTRNAKQAQTHMQKCKEKILRHRRRRDEALRVVMEDSRDDAIRMAAVAAASAPMPLRRSKHADNLRLQVVEPIPLDLSTPAAAVLSSTQSLDNKVTWNEALDYFWMLVSAPDEGDDRIVAIRY